MGVRREEVTERSAIRAWPVAARPFLKDLLDARAPVGEHELIVLEYCPDQRMSADVSAESGHSTTTAGLATRRGVHVRGVAEPA